MTNTCKQCRWFREHSNPEANGMGICVAPLPPTIERMIGKSGSVLFKEDMERGCALLTPAMRHDGVNWDEALTRKPKGGGLHGSEEEGRS